VEKDKVSDKLPPPLSADRSLADGRAASQPGVDDIFVVFSQRSNWTQRRVVYRSVRVAAKTSCDHEVWFLFASHPCDRVTWLFQSQVDEEFRRHPRSSPHIEGPDRLLLSGQIAIIFYWVYSCSVADYKLSYVSEHKYTSISSPLILYFFVIYIRRHLRSLYSMSYVYYKHTYLLFVPFIISYFIL